MAGQSLNRRLLLAALALIAFPVAQAQDTQNTDSTVVYPASYFIEFAPLTAQDMLSRIPGMSSGGGPGGGGGGRGGFGGGPPGGLGGGGGGRGFGSGGGGNEILINGKRTAGKNNQTSNQLTRITASQVDYIEIIRGTSGSLDVRGSGQVVNVVLFEQLNTASTSYEVSVGQSRDSTLTPGGNLSFGGQLGGLSYLLNAGRQEVYNANLSKENSILGDFSANDRVREERVTEGTMHNISTNLGYDINSNSSARFNALYSEGEGPSDTLRWTTNLRAVPNTVISEREKSPNESENWEIGGDYEYNLDRGDRFKILFISNSNTRSSVRERFRIGDTGAETKNLFLGTGSTTRERIVRSSYTLDILSGQNIEFGAERAQTILDSRLALGLPSLTGIPSAAFGGLVPVAISNANSTVEEIRIEPFAIHNWVINPRMTMESTLLYEMSEITQSGDVRKQRDFTFLKPKVDLRYNVTPTLQLRGSIGKVVEQLSFSDFVASSDNNDNDANTRAGNENLSQEWYWNYELNTEYRLPNDVGVVDGSIYYRDYQDKIERVDVTRVESNLLSANGNIGDGWLYGMNLNASIRMRMIDMPNLLLTSRLNVEDSEITDPFLGVKRRFTFNSRGRLSLGFRHDISRWNMNYGMQWNNSFDGNRKLYDIDDIEESAGDPFVMAFAEVVAFGGLTIRLDAVNFNNNMFCRDRQRFVGRVSAGILEEIEYQCSSSGRQLSLKVSGNF